MFRYFCSLTSDYGLPVLPIAVFSYATPLRAEPTGPLLLDNIDNFVAAALQIQHYSFRCRIVADTDCNVNVACEARFRPGPHRKTSYQCPALRRFLQGDSSAGQHLE